MAAPHGKRKVLSYLEKMTLLKEVDDKKLKRCKIAENYGVSEATVSMIVKNRNKIEEAMTKSECSGSAKRLRKSTFEDLDTALYEWFKQVRSNGVPVNGPIMFKKAEELAERLGLEEFRGSKGWFERFKKRRGITFQKQVGEAGAVSEETVEEWVSTTLPALIDGYEPNNIYNCDETALFFKLLPDRTYEVRGKKCTGGKKSKERVTVLLCCNADGSDKHVPLVIGKAAKPRCFKNIRSLPVIYKNSKRAWMTSAIFVEWLRLWDRKLQMKERFVVLLLDHCPAHPSTITPGLVNIKLVFFPPNSTSMLQPLDQGIIRCLKTRYRHRVIQHILFRLEHANSTELASISLLEALHYVKLSWNHVDSNIISNCFRKAGVSLTLQENNDDVSEPLSSDSSQCWDILSKRFQVTCDFHEYVTADDDALTCDTLSDQQICNDIMQEPLQDSEEDSDEEVPAPTHQEVLGALDVLKRAVCSAGCTEQHYVNLLELECHLTSCLAKKQASIKDYFKPGTK